MKKKLLMLTIVGLFGYQLCQAYTFTVYNSSGQDLEVSIGVLFLSSRGLQTKKVMDGKFEKFKFSGKEIGFCFYSLSVRGDAGYTFVNGSKLPYMESLDIRQVDKKGKPVIVSESVCESRNIMILRESGRPHLIWKWASKKEIDEFAAKRAKEILKPIKIPTTQAK